MKTPEQIAAEVIDARPGFWRERSASEQIVIRHDLLIAAIEADRAQREFPMSDPMIELQEWASTVSQLMAEDKSNDWSEEIAQLQVIEERLL